MMRLIGIELFKLRTQRAMRVIFLTAVVISVLGFTLFALLVATEGLEGIDLSSPFVQRQLLGNEAIGPRLLVVFAIVAVTGEFRHRTIGSTFLATPVRYRSLLAKLIACMIVALVYGLVVSFIATAGLLIILAIENVDLAVTWGAVGQDYLRELAALAIYAAFGFGIGSLVANQIAGIVIVLVETFVAALVLAVFPKIGQFFPSQARAAFVAEMEFPFVESLSRTVGGLVFLGWAVVFVAAGIYLTQRRDIT